MIEASRKSIDSLSIMIQSILTSYENKHLYKLKVVNMINTQQLSKNLNGNKERKCASVLTINQWLNDARTGNSCQIVYEKPVKGSLLIGLKNKMNLRVSWNWKNSPGFHR